MRALSSPRQLKASAGLDRAFALRGEPAKFEELTGYTAKAIYGKIEDRPYGGRGTTTESHQTAFAMAQTAIGLSWCS
jgi:hypothetical protein